MRKIFKLGILATSLCLTSASTQAQEWKMAKATIMTHYAATIDTANVLGEYPRPQMAREKWMNLNGIWQFQPATSITEAAPKGKLASKILVPF
ncbi:MAG TPA: beta-galactosidase, partial [Paludibacter sp.]|nr:beta-galactosidase [Paludibacter sp.]